MRNFFLKELPKDTSLLLKGWETLIKDKFHQLWATSLVPPNKYHKENLADHLIRAYVLAHEQYRDPLLSFACLVHDIGKVNTCAWDLVKKDYTFHGHETHGANIVNSWMWQNDFTKEECTRVDKLVINHGFRFYKNTKESTILTWLIKLDRQGWEDIIRLVLIDRAANIANQNKPLITKERRWLIDKVKSWQDQGRILFPDQLLLKGQEIASLLTDKSIYEEVIIDLVYLVNSKPEYNTKIFLEKQVVKKYNGRTLKPNQAILY